VPIVTALVQYIFDIRLIPKLVYFSEREGVNLGVKQNRFLAVFPLNATDIPNPRLLTFSPVHMVEGLRNHFCVFRFRDRPDADDFLFKSSESHLLDFAFP